MTIIYTIGHSNHPLEHFLARLREHRITLLVDVRSHPYSRWAPQFRKRQLDQALNAAGVQYLFMGESLGGRPAGDEYYSADGKVDYVLRARAADFRDAIENLVQVAPHQPTVLLCAEEDPTRCHRRLLITPALLARGLEVTHIRGDARLQPEAEYGTADGQFGLFG